MTAILDSSSYLTPAREQELAEFAEWVADEHCPSGQVDPDLIARENDITVSRNDYGQAFDGLLEHQSGAFHIYCNTARSRVTARARFTLAHELGHFYIDEHRAALRSGSVPKHNSFCDFRSKNPAEREADCFASNLLMPPSRLLAALGRRSVSFETVDHLAKTFGVSRTSTAVRLVRLDRAPAVVILHNRERFLWKWPSASARSRGLRSALVESDQVPGDSATGKALALGPGSEGLSIQSVTTAAAWFRGISPGTAADFILREEAANLGEHGVLTLLLLDDALN